ncbi:RalA-binding protein 1 [Eumeta japonica]|uniref:RalA-binding protein 1 n=1 Tax=Eumeta variegata TaxID=151549 RepID=A0A4C1T0A7_EUMVA|nr:RalA-binding protein 1 [Eumeta japonica]
MELDSPDVEKEFPGLYASEGVDGGKSKKIKDESDLSLALERSRVMMVLNCHYSYVPPLTSSSPNLPDTLDEIQIELCKQESLLNQIHSEMNAGFVSKKREEQLWKSKEYNN